MIASAGSNQKLILISVLTLAVAVVCGGLVGLGAGIVVAVALFVLMAGIGSIIDSRVAAIAIVFLLPISVTKVMPHQMLGITGLNPLNAMIGLGLVSLLFATAFGRTKPFPIPWRFVVPFVVALGLAAAVGMGKVRQISPHFYLLEPELYSTAGQYVRDVFFRPLLNILAIGLVAAAVAQSKQPERWITLATASALALPVTIVGVVLMSGQGLSDLASPSARMFLSATGMHANVLQVVLLPAYAAALFMLPASRGWARVFYGAATLALLIGLTLTFSRAAFLSTLLVTVAFFAFRRKFRYFVVGALVFLFAALVVPDAVIERATVGFDSGQVGGRHDPLTAGRVGGIWLPLLPEIVKHPVLGDGINSTMWSEPSRRGVFVENHPHNAYLRLLMDHGLVGGALVLLFLWRTWRLFRDMSARKELPAQVNEYFRGVSVAFVVFVGVQCMAGTKLVFDIHIFYLLPLGIGVGLVEWTRRNEVSKCARSSAGHQKVGIARGVEFPGDAA